MRTKLGRIAVAVVGLMLVATACSKSSNDSLPSGSSGGSGGDSSTTMTIGSDTANDHGQADATGKTSIEVEQDDFYFNPTVIAGSPGQTIGIELKNEGSTPHTFTIDALGIDETLQPDESKTVQVTFPDSGFTEFYCRIHRGSGMVGELTVG